MEADTENKRKRGRPKKTVTIASGIVFPNLESRTAQNLGYVAKTMKYIGGNDRFFVTEKGNFRRQAILEQIGRMLEDESIFPEQVPELIEAIKEDYRQGMSVKEIEKILRKLRMVWKYAEPDPYEEV